VREILDSVAALVHKSSPHEEILSETCRLLRERFPRFDWVGFYVADPASKVLRLGPYVGEPSAHTRIPYGRGICGQVAISGQTYVSPDVTAEANYLSCSISVRSEIVVPLFLDGAFVAQLDIDSDIPDAFSQEDRQMLEQVCELLAPLFRPRHIYLHGLSSSPLSKKGDVLADGLAECGHFLLKPDMNVPSFEQLTLSAQVEALEELAETVAQPFVLAGSSLGGLVSLIFADRHPEKVSRLLLVAPAFKVVGHRLAAMAGSSLDEWAARGYIDMVHFADGQVHRLGYQLVEDAAKYDFDALSPRMPTLVVHGARDEAIPIETVRTWVSRHPDTRLVELDGGDHSLQTCFTPLWDACKDFLVG